MTDDVSLTVEDPAAVVADQTDSGLASELEISTLERAGRLADACEYALRAARAAGTGGRPLLQAKFLARASELTLYTQGSEEAEILAREACALTPAWELTNPATDEQIASTVEARLALARVHLRQHTDRALDDARVALDQIANLGTPRHRATWRKLLGLECARRGRPRQALSHFEAAYRQADGHPALRARVLLTWAVQLRNWGLFDDAQRYAERSLEIRLQLEDHYGAAMCYGTLAFIYQRQGLWERERDALVADLRLCERIGGKADVPGLHARLAGALIGMGKYAGAWTEAERAIALESERIGQSANRQPVDTRVPGDDIDPSDGTRVHAFAWRELARVCLAQERPRSGIGVGRSSSRDIRTPARRLWTGVMSSDRSSPCARSSACGEGPQ